MHDQVEITIAGKTSRMKPEELAEAYGEWVFATRPGMKRGETAYDHDKLLAFLQTYGK